MKDILLGFLRQYTSVPDEVLNELVDQVPFVSHAKGTVLLRQGDIPAKCYFVLRGLVRQYFVDMDGNENTVNFFAEKQTAAVFAGRQSVEPSRYSLQCLEDSVLLVGSLGDDGGLLARYPFLDKMLMAMLEDMMAGSQESYANALSTSPEERYLALLGQRPELIRRVPQYQLASYLGIKPESLSRLKRRLHPADEKPQRKDDLPVHGDFHDRRDAGIPVPRDGEA